MNSSDQDDLEVLDSILRALRPLSLERRQRLIRMLASLIGPSSLADTNDLPTDFSVSAQPSSRVPFSTDLSTPPKQFLLDKQPRTDVERIACLAYYLTHYRDTPHFKTIDLSKLNTEAAQPRLSNPNYATKNALTYGYLAQATKGHRQLSAAGEQFVNALPDRVAARSLMAQILKRRRLKRRTKPSRTKAKKP